MAKRRDHVGVGSTSVICRSQSVPGGLALGPAPRHALSLKGNASRHGGLGILSLVLTASLREDDRVNAD